MTDKKGIR